jgi:Domain of unknown function (DUF4209)
MPQVILEELYQEVEQLASSSDYRLESDMSMIFQTALKEDLDPEVRHQLEWEIGFWNGHWTNESWQPSTYQVLTFDNHTLTDDEWSYFERRATTVTHAMLQARYAHFLWQYRRSEIHFANLAVDAYLEWVNILEAKDASDEQGFFGLELSEMLPRLLGLCLRSGRHRFEDVKTAFLRLATNHCGSSALLLTLKLGECMLDQRKVFTDLKALEDHLWNLAAHQPAGDFETLTESALRFGSRVSTKQLGRGNPDPKWSAELGEFLLRIADTRQFQSGRSIFLHKAAQAFREAGLEERRIHAMTLFETARTEGKLGVIQVEFNDTERLIHQKQMDKFSDFAKETAKEGVHHVLMLLGTDPFLMPDVKGLSREAETLAQQVPLLNLFATTMLDARGNVSQIYNTSEEKKHHQLLQSYLQKLSLSILPFVNQLLIQGVKIGGLNADRCLEFLEQYTWLGEVFETPDLVGGVRREHWLTLIEPAIRVYFDAICRHINDGSDLQPQVLFVDSVVVKLEGMLRRMFANEGIPMVKFVRGVERESDINDYLNHPAINEFFDENTAFFLRYVLIDKGGLNLRHEVSHALLTFDEYNRLGQAQLLLIALLRIACLPQPEPSAHNEPQIVSTTPGVEVIESGI